MGGAAGAPAVPPGDRGLAALVGLLRGEQGGVRGVRRHHAAGRGPVDRRGLPRRRRAAADLGHTHGDRRRAAARRARAGRAADHGGRGAHQVPGQGGERRGQARRPAGGAARRRARLPAPAAGRAAVGRRAGHRRASSTSRGIRTVGEVAQLAEAALVSMLGQRFGPPPPRARPQPRPAAGAGAPPAAVDRVPARARPHRRGRPPPSTPSSSALVDRVTRRLRAARRVGRTVVLRLRFDDFSRATRSHTLSEATAHTQHDPRDGAGAADGRHAADREPGPYAARRGGREPRRRSRVQLALPFDGHARRALDAALDVVRDRFGTTAITRAVLLGRDQGLSVPMLPD